MTSSRFARLWRLIRYRLSLIATFSGCSYFVHHVTRFPATTFIVVSAAPAKHPDEVSPCASRRDGYKTGKRTLYQCEIRLATNPVYTARSHNALVKAIVGALIPQKALNKTCTNWLPISSSTSCQTHQQLPFPFTYFRASPFADAAAQRSAISPAHRHLHLRPHQSQPPF